VSLQRQIPQIPLVAELTMVDEGFEGWENSYRSKMSLEALMPTPHKPDVLINHRVEQAVIKVVSQDKPPPVEVIKQTPNAKTIVRAKHLSYDDINKPTPSSSKLHFDSTIDVIVNRRTEETTVESIVAPLYHVPRQPRPLFIMSIQHEITSPKKEDIVIPPSPKPNTRQF